MEELNQDTVNGTIIRKQWTLEHIGQLYQLGDLNQDTVDGRDNQDTVDGTIILECIRQDCCQRGQLH